MQAEAIHTFLRLLGVDAKDIVTTRRGWVQAPCLLALWTHAGGMDNRPSFGISIGENKMSFYYCFSCMPEGRNLGWLLHNLWIGTGVYPVEAAKFYAANEIFDTESDEAIEKNFDVWLEEETYIPRSPIPQKVLKQFPLLMGSDNYQARRCIEYLVGERKISKWVINMCRIRYSYDRESLVFPMTDLSGNICVLRCRRRKAKSIWTVTPELAGFPELEFPSLSKDTGAWSGLDLMDQRKPVLCVEGDIDRMRLITLGYYNVIASSTSSVSDLQLKSIIAPAIIMGYDADKAGELAHRRIKEKFGDRIPLFEVNWAVAKKEDGTPCKDAGDLVDADSLHMVLAEMRRVN